MTAVFIHGVPDTYRVWDNVRACIGEPSLALALPGFGTARPGGFEATKEAYLDWIVDELERQPEPVDLVGHDWGSLFTLRVASLRPDLVRSWAGGGATIRAVKVWHELARTWQTPGKGEAWMARADARSLSARLAETGVPPTTALEAAERMDATMKTCILDLYRSAVLVGQEWEADLARMQRPGLILWGEKDLLSCAGSMDDREADAAMARTVRFESCGHWWPYQNAGAAAEALLDHWKRDSVSAETVPEAG